MSRAATIPVPAWVIDRLGDLDRWAVRALLALAAEADDGYVRVDPRAVGRVVGGPARARRAIARLAEVGALREVAAATAWAPAVYRLAHEPPAEGRQ